MTASAGSPELQGREASQTSKKHHAVAFSQVHAAPILLCAGEQLQDLAEELGPPCVGMLGFVMQRLGEEPENPKVLPYPAAAESETPWKDSSSYESEMDRNSHSLKVLSVISVQSRGQARFLRDRVARWAVLPAIPPSWPTPRLSVLSPPPPSFLSYLICKWEKPQKPPSSGELIV